MILLGGILGAVGAMFGQLLWFLSAWRRETKGPPK